MFATKLDFKRLAVASVTILVAAAVATPMAFARGPHHGPGPGFRPLPPLVRPLPPPPPVVHYNYYRHDHYHRSRDWNWVWAPLAFGAAAYGISALIDNTRADAAAQSAAASAASAAQSAAIAQGAAANAQSRTVYWCEGEQGFYPQVRSCPTGWTALPAQ